MIEHVLEHVLSFQDKLAYKLVDLILADIIWYSDSIKLTQVNFVNLSYNKVFVYTQVNLKSRRHVHWGIVNGTGLTIARRREGG